MAPSHDPTNDIYGPPGPPVTSVFGTAGGPGADGTHGNGIGSLLRTRGAGGQTVSHGSRTITINATEAEEEGSADEDDHAHGVLSLTGEPSTERRVQWDDDVIDNEHLNKKKSKICCIFKRQKEFDESSDESSSESDSDSSGSESDGGPVSKPGKGKGNNKDEGSCGHDHSDPNHQHHHHNHRAPKKPKKRVLNEYERMPKVKSSVPRPVNQEPEGSGAQP
ncbi:Type 1 phosphatases regulator ypi1 [Linnemannia schmuckeri]|uniref:Type 1 phosphatases regulator n=1 Tax=Linnemannia schmuckeri TaxID=64567 RepID=A0A9P5VEA7_9FUNG|nr:Type 1 phosphatases regulator ypi1 [Linnemannia schmuckeri]